MDGDEGNVKTANEEAGGEKQEAAVTPCLAECLAKATPMVLLDPVIGQESANADYLARAGVATIARNPGRAVAETARLLADPRLLSTMADAARRLHRPATQIITERILETI